jgi:photosystem II stability/assembly factor-like uncharacterized protein
MAMRMRLSIAALLLIVCATAALVNAQGKWTIVDRDLYPVLIGISAIDNQTVYMSGGQDGSPPEGGPQVYKSTDGGNTWNLLPHAGSAMMFLDVAFGSATNGVVAGLGLVGVVPGVEYTKDGKAFNKSDVIELADECQSVETIKGVKGGFGLTGEFGQLNGCAISLDGGATLKFIDAKVNTSTRYGSFPTANTWYLAAGDWPSSEEAPLRSGEKRLSQRITIHRDHVSGTMKPRFELHDPLRVRAPLTPDSTYHAAIAKTTDGGKTWNTVFYDEGNFYFNGISCPSQDHCFVVGESEADSAAPGSRILHTADGGKTWEVQLYNPNPAYSLMAIEFISETEGWAAGGELDAKFQGQFWHTTDAGKTWTADHVFGIYGNDLSFVTSGTKGVKGFATAFDIESQSAVMIYA